MVCCVGAVSLRGLLAWRHCPRGKRSNWTNLKLAKCRKRGMGEGYECYGRDGQAGRRPCLMAAWHSRARLCGGQVRCNGMVISERSGVCWLSTPWSLANKCPNHARLSYRRRNAPLRRSQRAMLQGRKHICDACDNVRSRNDTRVPIWQVVDGGHHFGG